MPQDIDSSRSLQPSNAHASVIDSTCTESSATHMEGRGQTPVGKLKNATKAAGNQIKNSLKAMSQSARSLPPVKSALEDMSEFIGIMIDVAKDDESLDELLTELQIRVNALETYLTSPSLEWGDDTLALVFKPMLDDLKVVQQDKGQGTMRSCEVMRRAQKIESHLRVLHDDIALRTLEMAAKQQAEVWLSRLSTVNDAVFNSTYATTAQRGGCTSGTRQELQSVLQLWTQSEEDQSKQIQSSNINPARILWMSGMAGTGKTTIAYSLCKWLDEHAQLGASFFCSRVSPLCRRIDKIVPTIAYQLGRFSQAYRFALCQVLEDDPDAAVREIGVQFEKLIMNPMRSMENMTPSAVVVIDALDECEDQDGAETIIDLLLAHAVDLPIKFFITSRPESFIREKMLESNGSLLLNVIHLHDIEASIVESDIKKYLASALRRLSPPPTEAQLCQLARQSGKLFIYAATLVRYVSPRRVRVDSTSRLKGVLAITTGSSQEGATGSMNKLYEELDALYRAVLDLAFNEALEEEELEIMRDALQTVICAKEPMSLKALSDLLGLKKDQISYSLDPLYSVLHISADDGPVMTLHASFSDFLLNRTRARRYHCDEVRRNKILAQKCFDVMKQDLRFNICKLETSFVADSDVPDLQERIKQSISPALFYACRFWGSHLQATQIPISENLHLMLCDFLSIRLILWMEVMNLTKSIAIAIWLLRQTRVWLQANNIWPDAWKALSNAQRFLFHFGANACSICTPHIYISALPLCARSSALYMDYWKQTQGLIEAGNLASSGSEDIGWASFSAQSDIGSILFSRDGTGIFYRTFVGYIETWCLYDNAANFRLPSESIVSFAVSSDGTIIVAGTSTNNILIYNIDDGRSLGILDTRSPQLARSIAISQIKPTYIASGDSDDIIRIWDIQSMEQVGAPLMGHKARIPSLMFSPTCMRLASGSADGTVRIWDVSSDLPNSVVLEGHLGAVNSISFSPDGTRLASGSSDRTIRLWDAYSGLTIGLILEGHTQGVSSIAFSPDGSRIVSGSSDKTIRFWDLNTGKQLGAPLGGHTGEISSIAYSPEGSYVASSHGKTIRIWDTHVNMLPGNHLDPLKEQSTPLRFLNNNECLELNDSWDVHVNQNFNWALYEKGQLRRYHQSLVNAGDSYIAQSQRPGDHRGIHSRDGVVSVYWGSQLKATIKTCLNQIISVAFSPRCVRIVMGLLGMNHTAELWEVGLPSTGLDRTGTAFDSRVGSEPDDLVADNGTISYCVPDLKGDDATSRIEVLGPITLTGDGWVKGVDGQLLFWFCLTIHRELLVLRSPRLLLIACDVAFGIKSSSTELALGGEWAKCYVGPHPNACC